MSVTLRTLAERRALFTKKAKHVADQQHFEAIMRSFPEELRDEIYEKTKHLFSRTFEWPLPKEKDAE